MLNGGISLTLEGYKRMSVEKRNKEAEHFLDNSITDYEVRVLQPICERLHKELGHYPEYSDLIHELIRLAEITENHLIK